jgi:hypothetical protein
MKLNTSDFIEIDQGGLRRIIAEAIKREYNMAHLDHSAIVFQYAKNELDAVRVNLTMAQVVQVYNTIEKRKHYD